MSDFILITGDTVMFKPSFGAAIVVVQPGKLKGSGPDRINGKPVCVLGDEKLVSVPGCVYTSGSFVIPGTGTLKIHALAPDQVAKRDKSATKPLLVKGSAFVASFEVQNPAKQPVPGTGQMVPDPTPVYMGSGTFITTNFKDKAN